LDLDIIDVFLSQDLHGFLERGSGQKIHDFLTTIKA
jgi:hypothetical protein